MYRWLVIPILIISLTGCEFLANLRDKIRAQLDKTSENVVKTVDDVGTQLDKTATSVKEKVKEVRDAAREVKEAAEEVTQAVDAVKKIGGETPYTKPTENSNKTSEKQPPNLGDLNAKASSN